MFNYRALNWEAIEAIHQEMKAIINREEKLAKKRFTTLSFQGLKKVAKFFSRLIRYQLLTKQPSSISLEQRI
jgi:hypothetical protein